MSVLDLLVSLDAHRKLQAVLNISLVAVTGLLALVPSARIGACFAFLKRPGLFLAFMAVAMFACRYPAFFYPEQIDPDEAQLIAQAITYETHPMPWRDVDGLTSGPLDSYVLLWCVPLGLQPTYLTSRFFELLLVMGMLMFLYGAARRVAGELAGRLALLPAFVFLALTAFGGFIHYSTEEVSVFLIAWSVYLLTGWRRKPGSFFSCAMLGFILGLLPCAKLQSMPCGGFLGLTAIGLLGNFPRLTRREALARIAVLVSAALLPGAILLAIVTRAGAFDDFWMSYVRLSQAYTAAHYTMVYPTFCEELVVKVTHVAWLFNTHEYIAFPIYLTVVPTIVLVLHFFVGKPSWPRATRRWLAWALLFALISVATALASPFTFPHYLFYLFPAFIFLLAIDFRLFQVGHPGPDALKTAGPLLLATLLGGLLVTTTVVFHHWPHPTLAQFLRELIALVLVFTICLETMHFLLRRPWPALPPGWQRFLTPAILVVFFLLPAVVQAGRENRFRGNVAEFLTRPPSAMDAAILQVRPLGGRLALWGWAPAFAAETQSTLGTREALTGLFTVYPNPLQAYYRDRYLRDMRANRPELFLEATGPDNDPFEDREKYGIACFPALAQLIADQYRLEREIDGMRLFVRKDLPTTNDSDHGRTIKP